MKKSPKIWWIGAVLFVAIGIGWLTSLGFRADAASLQIPEASFQPERTLAWVFLAIALIVVGCATASTIRDKKKLSR